MPPRPSRPNKGGSSKSSRFGRERPAISGRKPVRDPDRPRDPERPRRTQVTRRDAPPLPRKRIRESAPEQPERRDPLPAPAAENEETASDVIFGKRSVLAALEAGSTLNRIWIVPQLRYNPRFLSLLEEARGRGAVIDEVSPQRLGQITEGGNHQGIAAQSTPFSYIEIEDLVAQSLAASPQPVLVFLDGVQDPHNLGAIARTTEALGMQGLVIPQRRAVGVTSSVLKVAAGSLTHLPVARVVNLNRAVEYVKQQGFWVYGAASQGQTPLQGIVFQGPIALVFGSEGEGISLLTQQHCDQLVSIPLSGKTESLNASVAAGIALYEIARQRGQRTLEMHRQQHNS